MAKFLTYDYAAFIPRNLKHLPLRVVVRPGNCGGPSAPCAHAQGWRPYAEEGESQGKGGPSASAELWVLGHSLPLTKQGNPLCPDASLSFRENTRSVAQSPGEPIRSPAKGLPFSGPQSAPQSMLVVPPCEGTPVCELCSPACSHLCPPSARHSSPLCQGTNPALLCPLCPPPSLDVPGGSCLWASAQTHPSYWDGL